MKDIEKINQLDGSEKRLKFPEFLPGEKEKIVMECRKNMGEEVVSRGRRYWADLNGSVFVVSWEWPNGDVSGDMVEEWLQHSKISY